MHKLGRCVRFSINPFLGEDSPGDNAFASNPSGQGLAIFLELAVELTGEIDPVTGFVVNVSEIDKAVRHSVVPIFGQAIRQSYARAQHIDMPAIVQLLRQAWTALDGEFKGPGVSKLALRLNPRREASIHSEDAKMLYFSEKFEFAAMHKLWNADLTAERNFEVFGKCANPTGHGHNYTLEVAVKAATKDHPFSIGQFEQIVDSQLIEMLDHKNLNADVPHFTDTIPTIENLAIFAWDRLKDQFDPMKLHCVTVWETDRTHCSYYG